MSTHQDKSLVDFETALTNLGTAWHAYVHHEDDEKLRRNLQEATTAITAAAQKYADERELMLMERLLHVEEIYDDGDEQQCVWTINTTDLHHAAKAVADRLRKGAS